MKHIKNYINISIVIDIKKYITFNFYSVEEYIIYINNFNT